jgi:hypothetical protein
MVHMSTIQIRKSQENRRRYITNLIVIQVEISQLAQRVKRLRHYNRLLVERQVKLLQSNQPK